MTLRSFLLRTISLGAALFAVAAPLQARQIAISEIMYHPVPGKPEFLEIWNFTRTPLDTEKWQFTDGVQFTFPDFNPAAPQDHFLKQLERVIISSADPSVTRAAYPDIPADTRILGPWTGALSNSGELLTLKDRNGVIVSTVEFKDGGWWPAGADGTGHSIHLVSENRDHDDWHNWTLSRTLGGSPGRADSGERVRTEAVGMGAVWKYHDLNQDLGNGWQALEYDDSAWSSGAALLGYETAGTTVVAPGIQTALTKTTTISDPPAGYRQNLITYYFRKSFVWNGSTADARFIIDHIIDDGAVFYLNGAELGRRNLTGTVGNTTPALPTVTDAVELKNAISGNIPTVSGAPVLRKGLNVFAAELHNSGGGDSDAMFGARLMIEAFSGDTSESFRALRLSEVHFADTGLVDWVELRNTSASPVSTEGLYVSARSDFVGRQSLGGVVPAGGYLAVPVSLVPEADGKLELIIADAGNQIVDAANVRRVSGRPSLQAVDGPIRYWQGSVTATEASANAPAGIITDVVISEIMTDPPSDSVNGEFIEFFNRGADPVDMSGWRLDDGVKFVFPPGTMIAPGGYLVVAANAAWLNSRNPSLAAIGDWDGRLSSGGELLTLLDAAGNIADHVDYRTGGDWPVLAGGDGSSLELINPDMDNSRPSAWRDSDESAKAAWTPFTFTGTYLQMNSAGVPADYKELHLFLVGDSYVQLRNISIQANGAGANLISNVTSQSVNGSSASGWLCQGTHWQSRVESGILHLISDGHGDNRANRAEIDCTALTQNTSYTLSFEARWVYGNPRLIAQTWDHSIGGTMLVPIPDNIGTPGAPNSRFSASALPQVDGMLHSPPVPRSTDPVVVTARVNSASPLTSVRLFHRADSVNNTNSWASMPMSDDGTGADSLAGDGIYSASVTAYQTDKRIVQFYIRADSQNGVSATMPRTGAEQPGMWVVDNTSARKTDLRRQRFIISDYWRSALVTGTGHSAKFQYDFPRLANHYFPAVFIHDDKEIYYAAGIRKNGSPWTRTDGSELDRGRWSLPTDRRFRMRERFSFDNDPTSGRMHHNRIIRYWLYLLGHPANEGEFCYSIINAETEALREDAEPESNDLLDRIYEDGSSGQLMRIDDEWWFTDAWGQSNRDANWLHKGTDSVIRYHTEWMARSRENEYDYGPLIELFRTITDNSFTQQRIDRIMDGEKIAMMAAVRGYAGDWDSFTLNRGKNGFMYRPWQNGKWHFLHWDSDLAFQSSTEVVVGSLGGVRNYMDKPYIRRRLNYYLTEMLQKYTRGSARIDAWLNAEENSTTAYVVAKSTYTGWFSSRESRILTEINSVVGGGTGNAYTAPFALTSPPASTASDTLDISGTAPSGAWRIEVVDHPEAVQSFTNQTVWTVTGLRLKEGQNLLTIRTLDARGNVLQTITHTLTKTGNAPPVVTVSTPDGSWNAFPGEIITLSTAGSYDPEGGPLTWQWSVSPSAGAWSTGTPGPAASWYFTAPGIYTVTLSATDNASRTTTLKRDIAVFSERRFASFGDARWPSWLTPQGIELKSNHSPAKYLTLEDRPGSLLVRITETSSQPLTSTSTSFPAVWTDLPSDTDWAVQTEIDLTGREFASCSAGLIVYLREGASIGRYVLTLDNGVTLAAKRAQDSSGYVNQQAVAVTSPKQTLRIWRAGSVLRMQYLSNGAWNTLYSLTLPAGTTAIKGGILAGTTVAQSVGVAFDYFGLVDPTAPVQLAAALRITEVMYHPVDGDAEWIELTNISGAPVNLSGVYFEQGNPVDQFTFGNESLAPGEFILITNNTAAFRARYGASPRLAGQWSGGSLNNAGETIVLRDSAGGLIQSFTYDDEFPWPSAADGSGRSLEISQPAGSYSDPSNWRAGSEMYGTPGSAGAGPDSDSDGVADGLEIVAGTDPAVGSSFPFLTGVQPLVVGSRTVQWPAVAGRTYRVEAADSPAGPWVTLATLPYASALMSYTENGAAAAPRFYRLRIVRD